MKSSLESRSFRVSPAEVLAGIRELPALPAAVLELIQSIGKDDISADQLARRVSQDQALAATTLRVANSSFYGMSRRITSVADATAILGLRALRSIATAAGLAGSFPATRCPGFDFPAFWRHAVGTALCAGSLARALKLDESNAFTLGLLHDIGRLALASSFPEAYAEVVRHRQEQDCPPLEAEQAVLGTDHTIVGGQLAEHWRFAPGLVRSIIEHHAPPDTAAGNLTDVVHVADNIVHALDLSHQAGDMVPPLSMPAWTRLTLNEATCHRIFRETEEQHEAICQALGVGR